MKKKMLINLSVLLTLSLFGGCLAIPVNEVKNSTKITKKVEEKKSDRMSYYKRHKHTSSNTSNGYNWQLLWSDEFNKGTQPNPEKWTYGEGYLRDDAKSYYTLRPKNVRLEYGCLVLEAHKELYPNSSYIKGSKDPFEQQFATYTSGRLKTENKFTFKYGKVDIRAKLQAGSGIWSQLSLISENRETIGWPECGEILMLAYTGQSLKRMVTSVFSKNNRWDHILNFDLNPTSEFHVWSLEWGPNQLRFYFDGVLYSIVEKEDSFGNDKKNWPFDKDLCLYLDLIIGGLWSPVIDDNALPAKLKVDYIRVYKDGNIKEIKKDIKSKQISQDSF